MTESTSTGDAQQQAVARQQEQNLRAQIVVLKAIRKHGVYWPGGRWERINRESK